VNRYNSRKDYNLGSSSTSKKYTGGLFPNTTRRHELEGVSKFDPTRDSRLGVEIYIEGMKLLKHHGRWSSLNRSTRRQNEIFDTDVESDLTACDSQEMQFCCRSGKNRTGSQIIQVMRDFLNFLTVAHAPQSGQRF
jgi:hypothetical protein